MRESDALIPAEEERRRAFVYLPADATLPMPHDALGRSGESGRATNRLGRFDLLGVVGEGAYGTVYRAHDPQLDRHVALKVPHRMDRRAG